MESIKIYLFMSFRTFRDIVDRFFTMFYANIGLCSQVRPIFYNGSEFCLAHAQRKFVEVVLYLKIISSPTLKSVESFMFVPGITQSWLLAA